MLYFFIFTTVLFFTLFVGSFYISYKALKQVRRYEQFYKETIEDVLMVSESIDKIISKRPLLVDDPDVHYMVRGLRIVQGILSQYGEVKVRSSDDEQQSKQ